MPFYLRKSIKAGPFRFNLSKSGAGLSFGIKGLRIGSGPRGNYIHAGRGGLYYRTSVSKAGLKVKNSNSKQGTSHSVEQLDFQIIEMKEIDSGSVLEMKDVKYSNILDELNEKQNR